MEGIPSFIRRSIRYKIPQDHEQNENTTPEAPPEHQPGQRTLMGIPTLNQRHLRDNSLTLAKPQHQGGTKTYGYPQNYPGESQRHHPPDANASLIYQFPYKGCNSKYVGETL